MTGKWIAVIGSPRSGGNTELITDYIIEGLNEKNIVVEKFHLKNGCITTCNGCEFCMSSGLCRMNDTIAEIIDNMKNADGFIFASPSHNYNVTASMKALIDRTFCLNDYSSGKWSSRLSRGKKAIIVGVCAGNTMESMGYTIEGMSKPLSELGAEVIDVIEYYDTKHIPVARNVGLKEGIIQKIKCNEQISGIVQKV